VRQRRLAAAYHDGSHWKYHATAFDCSADVLCAATDDFDRMLHAGSFRRHGRRYVLEWRLAATDDDDLRSQHAPFLASATDVEFRAFCGMRHAGSVHRHGRRNVPQRRLAATRDVHSQRRNSIDRHSGYHHSRRLRHA
jgi:hypothetical protein